ncbi:MAG: GtrA family protein [Clostridiales bacterium]|jgi:putative flippase GtrA|nr:GtrA family protein [Clostridiales bacterium]
MWDKIKGLYNRLAAWGPMKKVLNREFITYVICGVLTTIIGIGVFYVCVGLGMGTIASNTISSALAVLFAFVVNKHFVFLSKDWRFRVAAKELAQFSGGRFLTYLVETGLLYLLIDILHFSGGACKIFTQVVVVVLNYIISKWIF